MNLQFSPSIFYPRDLENYTPLNMKVMKIFVPHTMGKMIHLVDFSPFIYIYIYNGRQPLLRRLLSSRPSPFAKGSTVVEQTSVKQRSKITLTELPSLQEYQFSLII